MICLIQRVSSARVAVGDEIVGAIDGGILALAAVEPGDGAAQARRMAERLLGYRIFADEQGRMNRSLVDTGGGLLLVPQFTLAADTAKGMRPSFAGAAPPDEARAGFDLLLAACRACHQKVACGQFGAHMRVGLENDGPVTFLLRVR